MPVAIGIDLGTTYCCVAVFRNKRVEIISNEQGKRVTPSYVEFKKEENVIGDVAKQHAAVNPSNTVFDVKRLIGRQYTDQQIQEDLRQWPFKVVDCGGKPLVFVEHEGTQVCYHPEQISAMVLSKLKKTAESYLREEVKDVVITVPTYFNGSQRQATRDAGRVAGLNVIRVINEPTAAAIAYGLDENPQEPKNILVFDLGGGTFDVVVMKIDKGPELESIAATGDTHLGGEDFDNKLVSHFINEFKKSHGKDISKNSKALRRLRTACEEAKRELSTAINARITVDALIESIDYDSPISRALFEELCAALFDKILNYVKKVLKDAKMKTSDIDDVLLVGGSSRIPKIQQMLTKFFDGKDLCRSINPEEAVAYGAAIQAARCINDPSENIQDIEVADVTPLSLGIEVKGGLMSVVIERNSTIPNSKYKNFTTVKDNQEAVKFSVYEGERAVVEGNYLLGDFILEVGEKMPKGVPNFKTTFQLDVSGILEVSAVQEGTKNARSIKIKSDRRGLSDSDIQRMLDEAKIFEAKDREYRERITARNDLESSTYSILKKIESVSHVKTAIPEADVKFAKEYCDSVVKWMSNNKLADKDEIKNKESELESRLSLIIRTIDSILKAKALLDVD